jgi:putative ABC transport system permease protein
LRDFFLDIRFACRRLLKRPGYAVLAVIVLGIGIGATTAIFSIVDALLLRPFAFPHPAQLVTIWATRSSDRAGVSPADFRDWQSQDRVFQHLAAYRWWDVNLTAAGAHERLSGCRVSRDFFETLGVEVELGRPFLPEEGQPGGDRSVILSHAFWQSHFGADPNVAGRTIQLNGQAFRIVGVLPSHLDWPTGADLWAPLALTGKESYDRSQHSLTVLGRLRAGYAPAQAQAEMDVFAQRLEQQYPDTNTGWRTRVALLRDQDADTEGIIKSFLNVLFAAAAFVLLIACANVANLQLAIAARRQTETAVRGALGASRWRVIRELLTESVIVAFLGGVVGALLAWWGVYLIKINLPQEQIKSVPGFSQMQLNVRSLEFALLVALTAGILSGLAPAWSASKFNLNQALKGGGRSSSGNKRSVRFRAVLVVSEVALAVVLLTATGLMVKGFVELYENPEQQYQSRSLLTLRLALPKPHFPDQVRRAWFYAAVLNAVRGLPKVESLGLVSYLPMSGDGDAVGLCIEGRPPVGRAERLTADLESVSPDYFTAMRIPREEGRVFGQQDGENTAPVAVVSRSFAQHFWPAGGALGHRLKLGSCQGESPWRTVVGSVGDVRQFVLDKEPRQTVYIPYLQLAPSGMSLVVRDSTSPTDLAPEIGWHIMSLAPEQLSLDARPMDDVIDDSVAGVGMATALIGSFGVVALILAAVGIYGLVSYSVSERTHEFGIRMALGAQPVDIKKLVLFQALKLGSLGLALGLPGSLLLGRIMTSVLFGLHSLDPASLPAVALALFATALFSGYFPALRASRVSPLEALRRSV